MKEGYVRFVESMSGIKYLFNPEITDEDIHNELEEFKMKVEKYLIDLGWYSCIECHLGKSGGSESKEIVLPCFDESGLTHNYPIKTLHFPIETILSRAINVSNFPKVQFIETCNDIFWSFAKLSNYLIEELRNYRWSTEPEDWKTLKERLRRQLEDKRI